MQSVGKGLKGCLPLNSTRLGAGNDDIAPARLFLFVITTAELMPFSEQFFGYPGRTFATMRPFAR